MYLILFIYREWKYMQRALAAMKLQRAFAHRDVSHERIKRLKTGLKRI